MLGNVLLAVFVVMLFASLPVYPYNRRWGFKFCGGMAVILLFLLILVFLGYL